MKRKLNTPVLALIVALSAVTVATTPTQATAQNAFVVGQTYQTSNGDYVSYVGNDGNGRPIFQPIVQPRSYGNINFSLRSGGYSSHRNYSHRRHFRGHRSHFRGHRGHRSRGHHRGHHRGHRSH